tara:strand:+ start:256 stop:393 length:138 start_codon:yes stop_codon:yes gene_type:complete
MVGHLKENKEFKLDILFALYIQVSPNNKVNNASGKRGAFNRIIIG